MAPFARTSELHALLSRFPRQGQVRWLGLRPARDVAMRSVVSAEAMAGKGLVGDRYASASGKRGVTLLQAEHLPVIAALSGNASVEPASVRRNVVVSGIPVLALRDRQFRIGDVLLQGTGPCEPCSRMETALGDGGYNAMRGHGGICARVIDGGVLRIGDAVTWVDA